jgi:hypothetical protein
MYHWGHFDGTNAHAVLKDAAHPTSMESEVIKGCEHEDTMARCLLSQSLPDMTGLCLDDYPTAKARWDELINENKATSAYAQLDLGQAFFDMCYPREETSEHS